ncbi:MAG: sugar 3,4-ketoisomerase [Acidiferrobacter sp.]
MSSWRRLNVQPLGDTRGGLAVYEGSKDIPFAIRRIFFLYDLPDEGSRGYHAHKQQEEVVICVRGGCTMLLDDGVCQERVFLSSVHEALYVPSMVWVALTEFAPNTILAAVASGYYDEADHVRDYDLFRAMVKEKLEGQSNAMA